MEFDCKSPPQEMRTTNLDFHSPHKYVAQSLLTVLLGSSASRALQNIITKLISGLKNCHPERSDPTFSCGPLFSASGSGSRTIRPRLPAQDLCPLPCESLRPLRVSASSFSSPNNPQPIKSLPPLPFHFCYSVYSAARCPSADDISGGVVVP
jgi:hypothetical protein